MSAYKALRDRLEGHLAAAKAIDRKTEDDGNRNFTDAEATEIQGHIDAMRALAPQVKAARADEKMVAKLRALGPDLPDGASLSGGFSPVTSFKSGVSDWTRQVTARLTKAGHGAAKDIGSGSILDIPNIVSPAIEIPARPTRLLDLIPTADLPGNLFSYAKQTSRVNNAATVADHAVKATSHYEFTEVEDRARVFAHLSDPIALRLYDDHTELMSIVETQMYEGLREEIEDNIAAGDAVGENFRGLLFTSGVLQQPYAVSVPATLRSARSTLEVANERPTAWILNPADAAMLDLLADTQERFYTGEIDRLMGNLPKISSTAIPAGHAILGDWSLTRLFVRQNAELSIDKGGELFTKNEMILRYEGRYGWACLRPSAFITVDLTSA